MPFYEGKTIYKQYFVYLKLYAFKCELKFDEGFSFQIQIHGCKPGMANLWHKCHRNKSTYLKIKIILYKQKKLQFEKK